MVYSLQEKRYFDEAKKFAEINGIDCEQIHINEWMMRLSSDLSFETWKVCLKTLEAQIQPKYIRKLISHYVDRCIAVNPVTGAFLLAKDFSLAYQARCPNLVLRDIESNLWMTVIKIESNPSTKTHHWNEVWSIILNCCDINIEFERNELCKLKPNECQILDVLIGKMLNHGKSRLASRICLIFNHRSRDLDIIYFCALLLDGLLARKSIHSWLASHDLSPDIYSTDTLETLENCLKNIKYAVKACSRLVLYHKISHAIDSRYSVIKEKSDEELLRELVKCSNSHPESVNLARELIAFASIGVETVAKVIFDDLLENPIHNNAESRQTAGNSNFLALIRLLSNPSILGRRFMEKMNEENAVEFCIKAHECFNLSCDIQGIAAVLRSARALVLNTLAVNKDYNSMVRLLNGIGRYSEMSYILDMLKGAGDGEFELFLQRADHKSHQLRVALLDSLKGDRKYHRIAFRFNMDREIAEILELDAKKALKSVFSKRPSISYKHELELILQEFDYSSGSYSKAGCFHRSDHCERLAELVALQIYFLPTGVVVINMNERDVSEFLANHPKFHEVFIININISAHS